MFFNRNDKPKSVQAEKHLKRHMENGRKSRVHNTLTTIERAENHLFTNNLSTGHW